MATSSSTRRMRGGIEETSASFEARSAPRSYPTRNPANAEWRHRHRAEHLRRHGASAPSPSRRTASVSFSDKKANYAANVEGVRNVLELADVLNVPQLTHVSTAYIAGNASTFSENDLPSVILKYRPRNIYEETKRIGESMVRAWGLRNNYLRYTIVRPSILIGREDGTSPTFDAYYKYLKPDIAARHPADARVGWSPAAGHGAC